MTRISSQSARAFTAVSDTTKILFPIADIQTSTPGSPYHMTAEQLHYMLQSMDNIFDVTAYGASTSAAAADNVTYINDAATAAAAVESAPYKRPILYVPPGDYNVTTGLVVPNGVDVYMAGANFTTATVDDTQPVLTIGETTGLNSGGVFTGIAVNCTSYATHKYDSGGDPDFAAVRFINAYNSHIRCRRLVGTYIGMQLYAAGDSSYAAGYNEIFPGAINAVRIGIDCRAGDASGAWCNENHFVGGNLSPGTSFKNYGSAYGVRFSGFPSGYTGQNHNNFDNVCFQMGFYNTTWVLTWTAGLAVTAGWRVYYDGREYQADGSGTTGATYPSHESGSVSDGGVSWTYIGDYRRTPVLYDDAGGRNVVRSARVEGTVGSLVRFEGSNFTSLSDFEFDVINRDRGNAVRDLEDLETATNAQVACTHQLRLYGVPRSHELVSDNWHKRAIGSAGGWTIAGLPWIGRTSHAFYDTSGGSGSVILCKNGIDISEATRMPCVVLNTQNKKRWRVYRDSFDNLGRLNFVPLDSDLARINMGTAGTPVLPPPVGASSATINSTYDYTISGSDVNTEVTFVAGENTAYVAIFASSATIAGLRFCWMPDDASAAGHAGFVHPHGDPYATQRRSIGTPTKGYFLSEGEFVANVSAASGQPSGWSVTTPGALAPAWAGTTAVIAGELRSNASKIYAAAAAGTTGSTAPTHSSGSASDDTITWNYVCAEAVLTALANLA